MNIKEYIEGVVTFHDIAGNYNIVTDESLLSQAKVVKEEGDELLEAVQHGDVNEILKECVDCLVVITGFFIMLEKQGYNVEAAWKEVNSNNLSKFTASLIEAEDSAAYYRSIGVNVDVEYNDFYGVYVLKNEHGKVMKPVGYKKASVAAFTPKGVMPVKEELCS